MTTNFPAYRGKMEYVCLGCGARYDIGELHYACPTCNGVFLLEDVTFDELKKTPGAEWRKIFDARASGKLTGLRGVFRYYELMAPVLEPEDIVYLGEGHTPVVEASPELAKEIGAPFAFKNDGQNPSASFKDRGMACAYSYLKALIREQGYDEILTVCASTGDTSAAAAMYGAYVGGPIKTVVILPHGKVTPQQLAQPLGSGAIVLETPGVFDDCMKVVERLAQEYRVALLNSKNAWRILGQESYAFEVAQWYDWEVGNLAVFVPIGNAGNVTAIMAGFLKLKDLGIIDALPMVVGVQSCHAAPVFRYYDQPEPRKYAPVTVQPSVAQAAMIGNPVSFPRVQRLAERFAEQGGQVRVVQVCEQEIMDSMLTANRRGHIADTQGGECLAGLRKALELGIVGDRFAVLDATAHHLKFVDFQDMYFRNAFPKDYEVTPRPELVNAPELIIPAQRKAELSPEAYVAEAADRVVARLGLKKRG